jgi:hypothetical protein
MPGFDVTAIKSPFDGVQKFYAAIDTGGNTITEV